MTTEATRGTVLMTTLTEEERILSGVLRHVREAATVSHATLPGELKLAKWLNCSRQQVRHALAQLEDQGIVIRSQGAATIVDPLALRLSARFESRVDYSEVLARMGYTPSVEVLEQELIPLPPDIATLLTPEATDTAVRVVRRWYADGQPAMVAEHTLPIPAGAEPVFPTTNSVFEAAHSLWGDDVAWEVVTAGVSKLDQKHAELLALAPDSVAKTWEVVGVTLSGQRIFHSFEHHHPDLVMYSFIRSIRAPWDGPMRG